MQQRLTYREIVACDGKKQITQSIDETTENVGGEFCSIDSQGKKMKRSVGEMEQEFLEALSSFYYDKKALLTDSEFDTLREELLWNGSKVAILDSDEQRLLQASKAYARGTPVLTDAEYDELVARLRANNSIVAAQGPRCSLRSRKLYSDATTDYLRMVRVASRFIEPPGAQPSSHLSFTSDPAARLPALSDCPQHPVCPHRPRPRLCRRLRDWIRRL